MLYGGGGRLKHNGDIVPDQHIPCVRLGDLSPDQVYEAELEENICRRDLTWQEKIRAIDELHRLRKKQNPNQTRQSTASEILGREVASSTAHEIVGGAELVAQHLDDPDVAKANSEREAARLVKRKLRDQAAQDRVAEFGEGSTVHTLQIGDSLELMKNLSKGTFDIICSDPPYGLRAGEFGRGEKHNYADDTTSAYEAYQLLATLGYVVTKPDAAIIVFCDIDMFPRLKELFAREGWKVFRTPITWSKGHANNTPGHMPWPDKGPRRVTEWMLYAIKGNYEIVTPFPDDLLVEPVDADSRLHAAQKPVELITRLLASLATPGSMVLDPFCGSGTIFEAATKCQMVATGFEADEKAAAHAKARMNE
jgi:DNA modification methylase